MARVRGNPQKLADNIVSEIQRDIESYLKKALDSSLGLIEDKKKHVIKELTEALKEEYSRFDENLKSLKARLDLELKAEISNKKSEIINKVIESSIKKLRNRKSEAWYKEFMDKVFERLAKESKEIGELFIEVSDEDKDLAQELINKYRVEGAELTLSEKSSNIIGGAIARDKNASIVIDYSLDVLIKENETLLRSIAAKTLFGRS